MSYVTPEQQYDIDSANTETMEFVLELLQKQNPLVVAGVLTATAFSLYKSILSPEDYDLMIDSIASSRDEINRFLIEDKRVLH